MKNHSNNKPSWVSDLPSFCNDISITEMSEQTIVDFRIGDTTEYTDWRDITTKSSIVTTHDGVTSCCIRLPKTDATDPGDVVDTTALTGFVFRFAQDRGGTIPHIEWPPTVNHGETRPITDVLTLIRTYNYEPTDA